eukprot:TRINITY_DN4941_c0_g1_i2.p2 TRINITY_DN4941_c0_g1~~TRINITY_DN4941_c0_g1_i2.p2  ORF type:complete len:118 (-),score=23.34 TRINITY_DN4941_c0_g1_i2:19-372(-)
MKTTNLALPHIRSSPNSTKCIIFICSISGKKKFGVLAPYVASKHGVRGFAGSLWKAVHEEGIKVSCILPGWVNTPFVQTLDGDSSKMMSPDDVADTVVFVAKFPKRGCPVELSLIHI